MRRLLVVIALAVSMCSGCDSKSTATGGDAPPPKTETLKGKDGKEETRTTVPD